MSFLDKIFKGSQARNTAKYESIAQKVRDEYKLLSDDEAQLGSTSRSLRQSKEIDLPKALAVAIKALALNGVVVDDDQIISAIIMTEGKIAETRARFADLSVFLTAYYLSLKGLTPHVLCIDYAHASAAFNMISRAAELLGVKVSVLCSDDEDKNASYQADIVYGDVYRFAADDKIRWIGNYYDAPDDLEGNLDFALTAYADLLLIYSSNLTVIIDQATDQADIYVKARELVATFEGTSVDEEGNEKSGDYEIDKDNKRIGLSDQGIEKVGNFFYGDTDQKLDTDILRIVAYSLQARFLLTKDVDYKVEDQKIVFVDDYVDEYMLDGYTNKGLISALQAKEGLKVETVYEQVISDTIYNYIKKYKNVGGVSSSGEDHSKEYEQRYELKTVVFGHPSVAASLPEKVYYLRKDFTDKVIEDVKSGVEQGKLVLLGTNSAKDVADLADALAPFAPVNLIKGRFEYGFDKKLESIDAGVVLFSYTYLEPIVIDKENVKIMLLDCPTEALLKRAASIAPKGEITAYTCIESDWAIKYTSENFQLFISPGKKQKDPKDFKVYIDRCMSEARERYATNEETFRKESIRLHDFIDAKMRYLFDVYLDFKSRESVQDKIWDYVLDKVPNTVMELVDYNVDIEKWNYDAINKTLENLFLKKGANAVTKQVAEAMNVDSVIDAVIDEIKVEYEQKILALAENGIDRNTFEKNALLDCIEKRRCSLSERLDVKYQALDPLTYNPSTGYSFKVEAEQNNIMTIESIVRSTVLKVLTGKPVETDAINKNRQFSWRKQWD